MVWELLNAWADPFKTSENGETALQFVTNNCNHAAVVRMLKFAVTQCTIARDLVAARQRLAFASCFALDAPFALLDLPLVDVEEKDDTGGLQVLPSNARYKLPRHPHMVTVVRAMEQGLGAASVRTWSGPVLDPGDVVVMCDLTSNAGRMLNGSRGVVVTWMRDRGRYRVKFIGIANANRNAAAATLDHNAMFKAVKPFNLRKDATPAPAMPGVQSATTWQIIHGMRPGFSYLEEPCEANGRQKSRFCLLLFLVSKNISRALKAQTLSCQLSLSLYYSFYKRASMSSLFNIWRCFLSFLSVARRRPAI